MGVAGIGPSLYDTVPFLPEMEEAPICGQEIRWFHCFNQLCFQVIAQTGQCKPARFDTMVIFGESVT